ncbi:MAG: hypothetical protein N3G20_03370 [Verrucomicrobiae bacterium]|nr:hypothetical protein [Verrucomicrobiae bacterium]
MVAKTILILVARKGSWGTDREIEVLENGHFQDWAWTYGSG